MSDAGFSITNKTKSTEHQKWCSVSFLNIKNSILGKNYSLSLVFIGEKKSKELNKSYRNKNKPTNILSFPLSKNSGEIFITPKLAKKESKLFDTNPNDFLVFLFIHGLLHLKGMKHGSTMDKAEAKLRKQFRV